MLTGSVTLERVEPVPEQRGKLIERGRGIEQGQTTHRPLLDVWRQLASALAVSD